MIAFSFRKPSIFSKTRSKKARDGFFSPNSLDIKIPLKKLSIFARAILLLATLAVPFERI
jgi:hypothetical protein